MTWLIWKIRSWFCKHEFTFSETPYTVEYYNNWGGKEPGGRKDTRVSALCKKCSFNRSFWKY